MSEIPRTSVVYSQSQVMNPLVFLFGLAISVQYTYCNPVKRCANVFDEGCINGGIPGGGKDEEWITDPGNTPGKRNILYTNLFDEGIIGGGKDEEWITNPGNTPGKRNILIQRFPKLYGKRCANMFDEGCINEGVIGGGKNEEWITGPGNTPGKRNILIRRFPKFYGKRCANMFDEGCINEGVIGGGKNEEWITDPGNTPGKRSVFQREQGERDGALNLKFLNRMQAANRKRCANLFDEGCINAGLPGSGNDEDWLNNGGTPGKR